MIHPPLRGDPLTSDLHPPYPPPPPRSFPVRSAADERYQRCGEVVALKCMEITQTKPCGICIACVVDIKNTEYVQLFQGKVKICTK